MKIFFSILLFLPSIILAQRPPDPDPLVLKLKKNAVVEFTGELVKWNGWPPNLRFITDSNKVIGIDYDHLLSRLKDSLVIREGIEGRFRFKFIGKTRLPYYSMPLLMFKIENIISLSS